MHFSLSQALRRTISNDSGINVVTLPYENEYGFIYIGLLARVRGVVGMLSMLLFLEAKEQTQV